MVIVVEVVVWDSVAITVLVVAIHMWRVLPFQTRRLQASSGQQIVAPFVQDTAQGIF